MTKPTCDCWEWDEENGFYRTVNPTLVAYNRYGELIELYFDVWQGVELECYHCDKKAEEVKE